MTVLLTGAAGFIGHHVATALLGRGEQVLGIDNLDPYYDVSLKQARLGLLADRPGFSFVPLDLTERGALAGLLAGRRDIKRIIHLAAQAGVRRSLTDPHAYVAANVEGHLAVLEAARRIEGLEHLVYASSSSVYGANRKLPFEETDAVDHPVSVYAATKRAGELLAESYRHLFGLPQSGLRFFTVYGPWGRPDMAYYAFATAIMEATPITLYDGGELRRDFTYIDDIVAGVLGCLDHPPGAGEARLLNIGNHRAERVADLVTLLERELGRRAVIRTAPAPATEVVATYAAIDRIAALTGFAPNTPLEVGVPRFVAWFKTWHGGLNFRVDAGVQGA